MRIYSLPVNRRLNYTLHQGIITLTLIFISAVAAYAQTRPFKKLRDGIEVTVTHPKTNGAKLLRIQVVTDSIIHVSASPVSSIPETPDPMIVRKQRKPVSWNVLASNGHIILNTSQIEVHINSSTGMVSFWQHNGPAILKEMDNGGTSFSPVTIEGKPYYHVRQVFQSPVSEAFYGLGEHQTGIVNLKGHDVVLAQHNTEAAVPFLVSSRNYGILWDNYSITRFGYDKPYDNISSLNLFDQNGHPGGLTATYADKHDSTKIFAKRDENKIDYRYLSDLKKLPAGFEGKEMNNSKVTWQGSISSDYSGLNKFRLRSAGYVKLWINGKLRVNRWRQAWNTVVSLVPLEMQKGKKYSIKLEWIPDGGQSYLSLTWRKPMPQLDQHELSLYSQVGKKIDYYFVYGSNMDDVVSGYRNLTGKEPILPKWAMGFWQSRNRYESQKQILGVADTLRIKQIPIDNIVQDWFYWKEDQWGSQQFDSTRYPDPGKMISELHHKYHMHYMISVWPKFYVKSKPFDYFWNKGWLYKQNVEDQQKDWVGYVSTFYDAFNPNARKAFWSLVDTNLFRLGVDAWWVDASEPDILTNSTIAKRKQLMNPTYYGPGAEYFNEYPVEDSKAFYNGQRSVKPNQRVFILTRSGYAGLQRYAAAVWSGDIGSRWKEMENQIAAGLNFSISGIPFWTTDIGGYAPEQRYVHPDQKNLEEWRELQARWYQFGSFCPLFRAHGEYPAREPYNIAPESSPAYQSILYYDHLRYRLMPYIYTLDGMTWLDDYTIMRPLVVDFPSDKKVRNIGDEYLYGPDFLVCPVYKYKARSRHVYLPSGSKWYDFYSGKMVNGGSDISADAPYQRMPLFVKSGSILPMGPDMQYTNQKPEDPLTIRIYTGADGHFTLYNDDDTTYSYEDGQYAQIPFTWNDRTETLTIGERKGSFNGMLKKRTFHIVIVRPDHGTGIFPTRNPDKTVSYIGDKVTMKF